MNLKIVLFALMAFFSCTNNTKEVKVQESHSEKHWSYEGETSPEHWVEIEKNSDCGGKRQSPINIIDINTVPSDSTNRLEIAYTDKNILTYVENNGHTIKFNVEEGDLIRYQGSTYVLKQIHFHEHSEHTINGIIYPIEIHLVHVNEKGELTVIGIMGVEGEESQLFEFFESYLPLEIGEKKLIAMKKEMNDLFPSNSAFYHYSGSLTTPPCTENVNWIIFKEPIVLSEEEVTRLRSYLPLNNYRNEQALNGRKVYFNTN